MKKKNVVYYVDLTPSDIDELLRNLSKISFEVEVKYYQNMQIKFVTFCEGKKY